MNCFDPKMKQYTFLGGVLGIRVNGELQPIENGVVELVIDAMAAREFAEQAHEWANQSKEYRDEAEYITVNFDRDVIQVGVQRVTDEGDRQIGLIDEKSASEQEEIEGVSRDEQTNVRNMGSTQVERVTREANQRIAEMMSYAAQAHGSEQASAQSAEDAAESARIAAAYTGAPLTANLAEDMTDISRIYVYTGTEEGMVNGAWYFFDGTAWTFGDMYLSPGVQIIDEDDTPYLVSLRVQNGYLVLTLTGGESDD